MELWFWIAIAVVMAIAEAATAQLVSLWFIGGAVGAIIVTLLQGPLWLQILVFALVSLALLLLLRPVLKKYMQKGLVQTNVDALIGRKALVIERIDNLHATGRIKLDGTDWTARSVNDAVIEADSEVVIRSIEGVKALVEQV